MIYVGCVVQHTLSGLYFKCENQKQERWMKMNPFYTLADRSKIPAGYFDKAIS